jgi:hypothetical protein
MLTPEEFEQLVDKSLLWLSIYWGSTGAAVPV